MRIADFIPHLLGESEIRNPQSAIRREHAEPQTTPLEAAHQHPAGARPPGGARAHQLLQLQGAKIAAPNLPALRLL
jgi:hypothetical protein